MLECLCPKTVCLNSNGNLPFQRTRIGFSRFEGEVLIVLILKCKLQKHNIDFPFSLGMFGGFFGDILGIFWRYFGDILEIFLGYFGDILGIF